MQKQVRESSSLLLSHMLKRFAKSMQNNTTLLAKCFALEQTILYIYLFYYFILHKDILLYYHVMN